MRYLYLTFLLLPLSLFAQKSAQVSGAVSADLSRVMVMADFLYLDDPGLEQVVKVVEGKFETEIACEAAQIVKITAGKRSVSVFVKPGATVDVQFNGSEADAKVLVTGDHQAENTYFLQYQEDFKTELNTKRMDGKVRGASIDLFELDLYDVRQRMQKSLSAAKSADELDPAFSAYMEAQIKYFYPRWLLAYPIVRANANEKVMEVRNLPRTIEDGIKLGEMNPSDLKSSHFRDFVRYYITYFNSKDNGFKKFTDYNKNVLTKSGKASSELEGEVLTWYQTQLGYKWCEKVAPGTMEAVQEKVNKGENGKKYKTVLEARCKNVLAAKEEVEKEEKKKGKEKKDVKPPKNERYPVRMVDLNGDPVHFSDFAGKVVYIDFWASWCGPCRRQFPYSKKLHAELEDRLDKKDLKNVVFLYVSIDKSPEAWKKAVEQFDLQGVQVRSAPSWPDGAAASFQINGIPRYMIMNREGEIVQTNAKRPSMPGIIDDIINLL